jgi:hypothetical protein
MSLHVLIAEDHTLVSEGLEGMPSMMAKGLSTKEIAAVMHLAKETVKSNQRFPRQKLGIRYWTVVNPKSILREFWHRNRKDK